MSLCSPHAKGGGEEHFIVFMVVNTAAENEENIHITPLSGGHPNTSIASPMSIEKPATTATPDTPTSSSQ